jgi:hypothetical protein
MVKIAGQRERMRHLGIYAGLCRDPEVIHDGISRGKVLRFDSLPEVLKGHEALVNGDDAVTGEHVTSAMGVVAETGLQGLLGGLFAALLRYSDYTHGLHPPL